LTSFFQKRDVAILLGFSQNLIDSSAILGVIVEIKLVFRFKRELIESTKFISYHEISNWLETREILLPVGSRPRSARISSIRV
jgi:hypothetical protein